MSPPDENNHANDSLREKLEELETLLNSDEVNSRPARIKIPVLDELVTEADFIDDEDVNDAQILDEQITELAIKLEQKFSGELDQLVTLLKSNFRNTIVEELRTQANIDQEFAELENEFHNKPGKIVTTPGNEDL